MMRVNSPALKTVLGLSGVVLSAFIALMIRFVVYPDAAGVVPSGVRVSGVAVAGLNKKQALEKLEAHPNLRTPGTFKLQTGARKFDVKMRELGYRLEFDDAVNRALRYGRSKKFLTKFTLRLRALRSGVDIPVRASWEPARVDKLLDVIASKVDRAAVNAEMDWATLKWSRHKNGLALNRKISRLLIRKSLNPYDGRRVILPLGDVIPAITAEKFEGIDFRNPLGTFQTNFSEGKAGRSRNLRRITELLTGYEIESGGTFSYNDVVGARTPENGFHLAPVIADGRIENDWGGGVCQPSSTLFNAALLAGMDSFQWSPHSRVSGYVAAGRDATVVYGLIDFTFRNPHPESVFVFATATQGIFTASLFSKFKPEYKVEIHSESWGRFFPGEKVIVDKSLAPGKRVVVSRGAGGMQAALFRKFIYPDGRVKQERMKSRQGDVLYYPGAKRIVKIGPPDS